MDKQEKKRDVAVFANMLKELMNDSLDDNLVTLDRDLQHFLYGRVAVLVKHNEGQPIGSVGDLGAIVGGAFAIILGEFISSRVNTAEELQKLVLSAKENMVEAFELRAPMLKQRDETPATASGGDITAPEASQEKVESV
jgi:hypothetical protein